jgi:hypothetical protein
VSRRCEELPRENRGAPRGALNFAELLDALGVFPRGLEEKLGIYLNDGQKIIELVSDVAGCLVRLFQLARAVRRIRGRRRGDGFALFALTA